MSARKRSRAANAGPRDPEGTRRKLLDAAKHLFAMQGLHGTSIQEISARAGVSSAMISHHFGGKEALYRACLAGFGAERLTALDRFLEVPRTQEEMEIRLELLVNELLDLHLREPEVIAILLRDVNAAEQWGPELEKTLLAFSVRFAQFFAQAKECGFLHEDVDPLVPAGMIYLALSGLVQADRHGTLVTGTSITDVTYRRRLVRQLLQVVLHGILPNAKPHRRAQRTPEG
jgi:AcrR family transcriptional regulator